MNEHSEAELDGLKLTDAPASAEAVHQQSDSPHPLIHSAAMAVSLHVTTQADFRH